MTTLPCPKMWRRLKSGDTTLQGGQKRDAQTKYLILAEQLVSLKFKKTECFSLSFYVNSQCLKRLSAGFLIMHSSNMTFLKKVYTCYFKIHTEDSSYERKMTHLTIVCNHWHWDAFVLSEFVCSVVCHFTTLFWFEECIIKNSVESLLRHWELTWKDKEKHSVF